MFTRFKNQIKHQYLIAKIFFSTVPLRLYPKVILGVLKNDAFQIHSPSSAIIGLTYRCQCRCVHCSASLYKKNLLNELTYSEIIELLDKIEKIGVPRINLSGGEALLRDDIFEIITYASKKFVTILESNGQLLTNENVLKLKKARISCVAISIDSCNPSIHDNLRGLKGCFDQAIAGISNCVKNKVPCLISTYIPAERANKQDINGLMSLAKRLGVLAVRVMPPRPVGSFSCSIDSLLSETEERKVVELINPSLAYFKGIPAPKQCGIFTKSTCYISPYGEVQPCPFMPLSFGKIKETPLPILLDRMWSHKIFDVEYRNCLILNEGFRKIIQSALKNSQDLPLEI